ncbi:MAG: DUF1343 domain-containing protein [Fluviicola sp.]|nr:DUF1343 domain-containing protein [Fluviicola sp.]
MKYSNAKFNFRLKYIKLLGLKSIFIFLISACANGAPVNIVEDSLAETKTEHIEEQEPIIVGAEKLGSFVPLLQGVGVGIVANQSSMVQDQHLVDVLSNMRINVRAVFSPEHGFRGDADAGEHVLNGKDKKTGFPLISLYGKNKKPTKEQLKDIKVMIFDIQDVGVRFYTYISTLHYVMEACAENDILLIVLDRPNPNGHYVDGPILEKEFQSFVGMHPVPIVHGMTIAEYARMINGEGWLKDSLQCRMHLVRCENYTHDTPYSLPIPPSPNLRSDVSIQLYPSLCLLEATSVTVGRGTDGPFERYGHPYFPKGATDFSFTPKAGYGSKHPKFEGKECYGFNLNSSEYARMSRLDLSFLMKANELLEGNVFVNRAKFFNLLAGNSKLLKQIEDGKSEDEIRNSWKEGLEGYLEMRKKYLLYE